MKIGVIGLGCMGGQYCEGQVPNIVYSCGALSGIAKSRCRTVGDFATGSVAAVLAAMDS